MELHRFRELAEAWGAERRRWPEDGRPLHDHFAHTPEGARILAEAAALDAALDALETRPADPLRPARILRAARRRPARRTLAWLSGTYAATALLGFLLGFSQPDGTTDDGGYDDMFIGTAVIEDYL